MLFTFLLLNAKKYRKYNFGFFDHENMKNSLNKIANHPFILRPQFLQFLEISFKKFGSRNLVREI